MTPTQRTLDRLRKEGWFPAVVERWIPAKAGGFRKDAFGILDIIAINGSRTLGVQSCGESYGEHAHKLLIVEHAATIAWLSGNRELEIWAWQKRKPEGRVKTILRRMRIRCGGIQNGEPVLTTEPV